MNTAPRSVAYSLNKAIDAAKILNDGEESAEDGWTFKVVDCKNGLGRIDVYDEDDHLIHKGMPID